MAIRISESACRCCLHTDRDHPSRTARLGRGKTGHPANHPAPRVRWSERRPGVAGTRGSLRHLHGLSRTKESGDTSVVIIGLGRRSTILTAPIASGCGECRRPTGRIPGSPLPRGMPLHRSAAAPGSRRRDPHTIAMSANTSLISGLRGYSLLQRRPPRGDRAGAALQSPTQRNSSNSSSSAEQHGENVGSPGEKDNPDACVRLVRCLSHRMR